MQKNLQIHKYPRTRHVEGSALQTGDEDLEQAPLSSLSGKHLVIEEKIDGANTAVSFTPDGNLLLQSRGHYLTGGPREKQYALLKKWASCHQSSLFEALGSRYIMYGEWLFAKHTLFYDLLPHYFLEFDIMDLEKGVFLDTPSRHKMLHDLPIVSVPVLTQGLGETFTDLGSLVVHSLFKSEEWRSALQEQAERKQVDFNQVCTETDMTALAEGLYIKVEQDGMVVDRLKWVRRGFLTRILDSGSHWHERPIIPNQLAPEVDIYAAQIVFFSRSLALFAGNNPLPFRGQKDFPAKHAKHTK